jgi:hypothetical protein
MSQKIEIESVGMLVLFSEMKYQMSLKINEDEITIVEITYDQYKTIVKNFKNYTVKTEQIEIKNKGKMFKTYFEKNPPHSTIIRRRHV